MNIYDFFRKTEAQEKLINNYIEIKIKPIEQKLKREFRRELKKKDEEIKALSVPKEKLIDNSDDVEDIRWKTLSFGGLTEVKSISLLEEYVSWTYANVTAIAEAISSVKFELYKYNAELDETEEVKEHPILEILNRPNKYMTRREFIKLLYSYYLLTGEAPIRIRKPAGNLPNNIKSLPYELWPVDPTNLIVKVGKTADYFELITGYTLTDFSTGKLNKTELKPEEIIPIKNINPKNKWRGLGVVEAAQGSIDTLHYSEAYNLNFFKNSAVPFTVLYTDQKLNAQIIDRLKNNWTSNYQGVKNAFKTAVLEAGLKVEKLQTSAKDMEFLEQQRFLRDKLMAMFKTTKIALGIVEDVNYASAVASEYVFMKNCIKPKMSQLIDSFNEFLLPLFDPSGEYFLDFEDPIPQDREKTILEYTSGVNKWLTVNEIRDKEGLPSLDGGDEIYQPITLQPIGTSLPAPVNEPANEPLSEPNAAGNQNEPKFYRVLRLEGKRKPRKDLSEQITALKNRNIRLKLLKEEFKKEITKFVKEKLVPKPIPHTQKYKDMRTKRDIDLFVKSITGNSDRFEGKMNRKMAAEYYNPQMNEILLKLNKGTKFFLKRSKNIEKQIGDEFMFDQKKSVKTGINLMTPLLQEILLEQGREAMLTVSQTVAYSLLEEARKYLNQMPPKLAKTITETAYTRVRSSLAEGIKAGESIDQLKTRVVSEYQALEVYQAEAIARTEVTRATNFASLDAYKQSGVVEGKQWIVTNDDRLCEYCEAMETTYSAKIGLDEPFFRLGDTVTGIDGNVMTVDYTDVDAPPLHVNCRCVLVSVEKLVSKDLEIETEKILDEIERGLDG